MNDPLVIRFVNEEIRPLAEAYRALLYRAAALKDRYNAVYSVLTTDLGAAVEDGRDAEGVSRLTCNDVVGFANGLIARTDAADADARALVAKICVRPLTIVGSE